MGGKSKQRLAVIYDGQCAFCVRSRSIIERLDTLQGVEFYDFHDREIIRDQFPGVKPEDSAEAMIAIAGGSRVFKGFYAFRVLIWRTSRLWFLAPLFYLPGVSYLGTRLYAWIGRHRRVFVSRAGK